MNAPRLLPVFLMSLMLSLPSCARNQAHRDTTFRYRFVHTSDTHFKTDTTQPASNSNNDIARFKEISALNPRPAFVVNTGDVTDLGTDPEFAVYRAALKDLAAPIYNTMGNHDVRWNPLGKEGFTRGINQKLYYSWDYNGIHFVNLDSTVLLQHWGHFDKAELDWLKEDLAKIGKQMPVILGFHHWIGRESVMVDNEQELLEIVEPYNVRLWLQGHGHADIEWNINGTPAIMEAGLYQGSFTVVDVGADSMKLRRRHWGKADPNTELLQPAGGATQPATRHAAVAHAGDAVGVNAAATQPATHAAVTMAKRKKKPVTKPTTGGAPAPATLPVVWDDLMTIPLTKPKAPQWNLELKTSKDVAEIDFDRADLPKGTQITYRFNQRKPTTMFADAATTRPSVADLPAGIHVLTAQAELPDGRAYQLHRQFVLERAGTPKPAWTAQVNGAVLSHLVRHGDTLYVTTMGNELVAIDPNDGNVRWTFHAKDSIFSTPHVEDGVVYFGSADHFIYAIDARSGKEKWKYETKAGIFAGPAVAKNRVAIASTDKNVYLIDTKSGSTKNTLPVGGMYQSKAATDGERFFMGGWDNRLRCVDAATEKQLWETPLGVNIKTGNVQFAYSPAIASPAVGDGLVYVTSNDGILHACRVSDGKIAWEFSNKRLGYSSPLYHGGKVYVAIGDPSKVFCLEAKTGRLLWAVGPRIEKVKDEETGKDKDVKTLEGVAGEDVALPVIYDSSCAYSSGHIYIASVDGTLNCVDAATGKLTWQYALGPGHCLASPAVDDRCVYISSMSGKVTALPVAPHSVSGVLLPNDDD